MKQWYGGNRVGGLSASRNGQSCCLGRGESIMSLERCERSKAVERLNQDFTSAA